MFSYFNFLLTLGIASGAGATNTSTFSPVDISYTSFPSLRSTSIIPLLVTVSQKMVSDYITSPVLPKDVAKESLVNVSDSTDACYEKKIKSEVRNLIELFLIFHVATLLLNVQMVFMQPYISTIVWQEQSEEQKGNNEQNGK